MIITHLKENEDINLKVDYEKLIGTEWCRYLKKYLHSPYQTNLMFEIFKSYSNINLNKKLLNKNDLFKSFKLTSPSNIRVVILNLSPEFNHRYNGLAFGNIDTVNTSVNKDYDENLIKLMNNIENYQDDGFKIDKDFSLESWAKQGVLLLNYPFYNLQNKEISYQFIKHVLESINDNKTGIIYVFIDKDNKYNYFKFIPNPKFNYILYSEVLNYSLLESINYNIEKSNGKDCRIKW